MAELTHEQALRYAIARATSSGLDDDTADAAARRAMEVWHPEFTKREFNNFIDEEIQRHAQP